MACRNVICGADNWVEIEEYGCAKEERFTKQLGLANGIPSHDTFARCLPLLIKPNSVSVFTHRAQVAVGGRLGGAHQG